MTITTKGMVDIDFSEKELDTMKNAFNVIDDIITKMSNGGYDIMYGGYKDCQVEFEKTEFQIIHDFLAKFLDDTPYEML